MDHLHETLAYLSEQIRKLTAAHDTLAEAIGADKLQADTEPAEQPAAKPEKPKPSKAAAGEPTKRKSKYFDPLVAFLKTGGKSASEIERHIGVQQACFVGVLANNPKTFRKVGVGRGSTWELVR